MIPKMGVAVVMAGSLPSRPESVKTQRFRPGVKRSALPSVIALFIAKPKDQS
jgi:hypothetical protein